ncbi:MAG TPA: tyrosine-type recombinase/integrase [Anaerolineaceae bacterium]|nr:tyrosine-type recombinase/integrase [Anaerolineaceae bacterium]
MFIKSISTVAQSQPSESYFETFQIWLTITGNRGHGRSARSVSAYLQDLRVFCTWFQRHTGQDFAPELITSTDLRSYFQFSRDTEHVKPATWNRRRISLALFCEWAKETSQMLYNPFQGVPVMEEIQQSPKWLDKSDYARFMRRVEQSANTAHSDHAQKTAVRDQAMIALMVYAGLRESEVADLTSSALLLSDRKGMVEVRNGKGGKTRRVPLGREARRAVGAWLELAAFMEDTLVFGGISTRQIQRVVKSIGREAGLSVTPHQLRHTMLKRFIDAGGQLTEAAKIAGHARLETTKRYVQPGWEDLELAVENL